MLTREGHLDQLTVRAELRPELADRIGQGLRRQIGEEVRHAIKSFVGISAEIEILDPDSIERTQVGKAKRVIDRRNTAASTA